MLNHRYYILSTLMLALLLVPAASAQITSEDVGTDKLAQTSFKFLKISNDARAAGMGDAMTATEMHSSTAMFYNPAGMARLDGQASVGFGLTNWIADITYNAISAAYSTGSYGVVGVSLLFADYGDNFVGTIQAPNEKGYTEYSELGLSEPSPTAMSIGLGYAIGVTDRFSVGANAKYVSQDLGDAVVDTDGTVEGNEVNTVAFDFGVLYKTGFQSLDLAMSVRNFAKELVYVDENFELPLTFNVGVSMNMMDLSNTIDPNMHALRLSLEAERPRDYNEQLKIGGEYTFMNLLSLRAGYTFPTDEQGISLGGGLNVGASGIGLQVNYAYTTFGIFDDVHRIGASLSF
jgi:hypothetical protein